MEKLSLENADKISSGVVECIKRNSFAPITVTVIDSNGDPITTKRMDGCNPKGMPEFAYAKANTCTVFGQFGMSSRAFRDKYTKGD